MPLSRKQTAILVSGVAVIAGLYVAKKKILGSIAAAQVVPPTPPNIMLPGMGADPTAFDKVADTTNKAISTLTGAVALTMGYFTLKEKKKAATVAPAVAPAVIASPAQRAPTRRMSKASHRRAARR